MSLRLIVVLMISTGFAACSGGYHSPSGPSNTPTAAPPGSTTVTIPSGASIQSTGAYNPNPLTIAAGTTVSWVNSDNTTHTATADGSQFSSGGIPPGGRFDFTFQSAGQFTYHCQIHPNMVGTIIVQ